MAPGVGSRPTRVLIAARSAIRQAGLEKLLANSSEFRLVGVCPSIAGFEQLARQVTPDIGLVDWDTQSDSDGVTGILRQIATEIRTVVLVDGPAPEFTAALLAMGVRGVIDRDSSRDEITSTLQSIAEGLTVLGADTGRQLAERIPHGDISSAVVQAEDLTERELEVLELLAQGIGNKEIAARLEISEHTVKFHISSILSKLSASNRTQAVAHGIRQGLIVI